VIDIVQIAVRRHKAHVAVVRRRRRPDLLPTLLVPADVAEPGLSMVTGDFSLQYFGQDAITVTARCALTTNASSSKTLSCRSKHCGKRLQF
jgi:hypothetical protein